MIEKIVKARKNYICDACGITIKKCEKYRHGKDRYGKYSEEDGTQIGVLYSSYRICENIDNCVKRMEVQEDILSHRKECSIRA